MLRSELIQDVQAFITSSFGIPPKLSEVEINRRINDSLRFFYREYDQALESRWYIIPVEYFKTQEFKDTRIVQLPECVVYLAECKIADGAAKFNLGEKDLSISRMIAADVFLGSYSSDDLVNRIAFASYYDLSKAFMKDWIRHDFNENTKRLYLEGSTPHLNLALRTYVKVDEQKLFDDYLFIDYVRGVCIESMGRMMSIMTMQMPGGVTVNADMLRSFGTELIKNTKEKIEALQPSNYVEFSH